MLGSAVTQKFTNKDTSDLTLLQNIISWIYNSFLMQNNVTCTIIIYSPPCIRFVLSVIFYYQEDKLGKYLSLTWRILHSIIQC